jgi:hypothetical protein
LFSPGTKGAIAGNFIMLDRLGGRDKAFPSADFARYSISASSCGSTRRLCALSAWRKADFCG